MTDQEMSERIAPSLLAGGVLMTESKRSGAKERPVLGRRIVLRGLDDLSAEDIRDFWQRRQDFREGRLSDAPLFFLGLSTRNTCNLRCIFCYGPEFRKLECDNQLSCEESRTLIDQAAAMGARSIIYCGNGEPTIDPNLPPLIQYAAGKGLKNVVVTNGQVFGCDKECIEIHGMTGVELAQHLYQNQTSLLMHIESLRRDIYERTAGVAGSYGIMLRSLEAIKQAGFCNPLEEDESGNLICRLAISTLVTKLNFLELNEIKAFSDSMNAQYLCKLPSILGDLKQNKDAFFEPFEDATIWLKENVITKLSAKPESITVDGMHCGAWHYGIVIANNGDVRFCYSAQCSSDRWIGNVREKRLQELVNRRERIYIKPLNRGEVCPVKAQWYKRLDEECKRS